MQVVLILYMVKNENDVIDIVSIYNGCGYPVCMHLRILYVLKLELQKLFLNSGKTG